MRCSLCNEVPVQKTLVCNPCFDLFVNLSYTIMLPPHIKIFEQEPSEENAQLLLHGIQVWIENMRVLRGGLENRLGCILAIVKEDSINIDARIDIAIDGIDIFLRGKRGKNHVEDALLDAEFRDFLKNHRKQFKESNE